ncbi:MAG TPA: hypothetical protein GX391_01510 [Firmicutes bacterium]|nr:hypothetical protein [Bacillota bacterium]
MKNALGRIAAVAAVFMGTVVGAGFASGQEIFQFFSRFGGSGLAGIGLSTLILGGLGSLFMQWGWEYKAASHRPLLYTCGPAAGAFADGVLMVCLVIISGMMLAGAGALFKEMGGVWGSGVLCTGMVAYVVLRRRLAGIRGFNLLVIPFLVATGATVACLGLFCLPPPPAGFSGGGWLGPSILYASYNLVLSLPVLVLLHRMEPDPALLRLGGWVGGIGLGIVALLFHLAITRTATNPITLELPLLPLLEVLGPWIKQAYAVILWGELFTTYIANVYGIVQRWGESRGLSYENRLLLVILATVAISRAGFARMIRIFYPLFGGFSLLLLLCLVLKRIVEKYGVNQ